MISPFLYRETRAFQVPSSRPAWSSLPAVSSRPSCGDAGWSRPGRRPAQYPEPDEELPAGAAVPELVTSCHTPPAAFRPLPLACPGAVSPTKVYSGCPSKVAWTEPSARLIVPNVPVTPAAVTGPVTGGQFCAHVPLHFDAVDVSGANEYSVKPLLLVSTVTPPIVAVFTVPAAAAAGLLPLVPLPAEEVADELHAASTAAVAATASTASSIRNRFRAPGRVSDLIIALSFAPGPAGVPAPVPAPVP